MPFAYRQTLSGYDYIVERIVRILAMQSFIKNKNKNDSNPISVMGLCFWF